MDRDSNQTISILDVHFECQENVHYFNPAIIGLHCMCGEKVWNGKKAVDAKKYYAKDFDDNQEQDK